MTTSEELHDLLANATLPHSELMQRVQELTGIEDYITRALTDAFTAREWDTFEMYLWAAFHHPTSSMTSVLCEALQLKSRSVPNEDTLEVLGEIKDPTSLACLREVLYWWPEWDEFNQTGVKALWAIHAVGTTEARQLVAEATKHGSDVVQVWARHALSRYTAE